MSESTMSAIFACSIFFEIFTFDYFVIQNIILVFIHIIPKQLRKTLSIVHSKFFFTMGKLTFIAITTTLRSIVMFTKSCFISWIVWTLNVLL